MHNLDSAKKRLASPLCCSRAEIGKHMRLSIFRSFESERGDSNSRHSAQKQARYQLRYTRIWNCEMAPRRILPNQPCPSQIFFCTSCMSKRLCSPPNSQTHAWKELGGRKRAPVRRNFNVWTSPICYENIILYLLKQCKQNFYRQRDSVSSVPDTAFGVAPLQSIERF